MQTLVWSSTARCGTQFAFWQTWQPGICSCLCQSSIGTFSGSGRSMIWLQVNFPVFDIEEYAKRNIQNQFKKVSATLKDWEEKRATRSQPKWTSLRGCLRFSWTCLQVLLKNKRPQRVYFISGRRSFCLPSPIPSPASQVIHNLLFFILFIYVYICFRWMLWKVQSGIAPPFFYVIIAEKDTLKTWRASLCPKNQNTIEPNV